MQGLIVLCLVAAAVAQSSYPANYPYTPIGYPSYPYNKYSPNYNYYNPYTPYNPYVNPYTPVVNASERLATAELELNINPPLLANNEATSNQTNQFQIVYDEPTANETNQIEITLLLPPGGYQPDYTQQGYQPPVVPQSPNTGLWMQGIPGFIDYNSQKPIPRPPQPKPTFPTTTIPTTKRPPIYPQPQPPATSHPSLPIYPQYPPTVIPIPVPQKPATTKRPQIQKPSNPQPPAPYPQYPPTVVPIPVVPAAPIAPAPIPQYPVHPYPIGPPTQQPQGPIQTQEITNPNLLKCTAPRGQFASDYCNTFINCWDGTAVEQFCPSELVFNPAGGYCDYSFNYICNKPYKYQETRPVYHPPPAPSPYPPATGAPISITPPPITGTRPTVTVKPPPAITAPPQAPPPQLTPAEYDSLKRKCLKVRGQFPTSSCNKYVNCWDAWVSEQECPRGLLFNLEGFCDYPENVDCYNRTVLPVPISDCPTPFGTFRNATHCNAAFTCSAGLVVSRFECPVGYNYNDIIGVCDFEYRVTCGPSNKNYYGPPSSLVPNVIQPVPAANPTFQPQLNQAWTAELCKTGKLVRLSHDCSKIALCRNNQPEIVSCNAGLGYDTRTDRCTLLQYAQC